ncbi:MAG: hypothetical protein WD534_07210 [Phycisphaeraceae bacterium]
MHEHVFDGHGGALRKQDGVLVQYLANPEGLLIPAHRGIAPFVP